MLKMFAEEGDLIHHIEVGFDHSATAVADAAFNNQCLEKEKPGSIKE